MNNKIAFNQDDIVVAIGIFYVTAMSFTVTLVIH